MRRNDSEERTLPATPKKLRDARKRGQVSRSRDLVAAAATIVAMLYLWLGWDAIIERFERLVVLPAEAGVEASFLQATEIIVGAALYDAVAIVAPMMALVAAAAIAAGALATRGFVFAVDPIKPRIERLHFVEGFKRIFSLRNLIELIKAIIKAAALFALIGGVAALGLDALIKAPRCGLDCFAGVVDWLSIRLIAVVAILFLITALIDLGVQRWLFLRDMRMTKTEFKRERKDLEGDPTIRQVRRRQRREFSESATRTGVDQATLIITDSSRLAVGLRYVRGQTPVPLVVCRGSEQAARLIVVQATRNGTPVTDDPDLAAALSRRTGLGAYVPRELFDSVSRALVRSGAV